MHACTLQRNEAIASKTRLGTNRGFTQQDATRKSSRHTAHIAYDRHANNFGFLLHRELNKNPEPACDIKSIPTQHLLVTTCNRSEKNELLLYVET